MSWLLDAIYLLALFVLSPWLLYKSLTTGKYRRGLLAKFLGRGSSTTHDSPTAWFHGVSVGEIHLLRQIVAQFRKRLPHWQCVISTTTNTGYDEARKRFPDLPVFYWPFDFSWAVRRALRTVNPSLVILAEGELWPNFLLAASARGTPVVVVNGRMSPRSFRRYSRLGFVIRPLLRHLSLLSVQTEEYAGCFRALGANPDMLHVTGSVKYDGVETNRHNPRTEALRQLFGIQTDALVWIAGSTQAPEEEICLGIYQRARTHHRSLRLILVPRQKERFEEVAALLQRSGQRFVRRSTLQAPLDAPEAIVLVDTIGELGAIWGLADVAFVGGSLDGRRGGQNMIEPAAYGAAVVFGPHVWNFRDTAQRLVNAGAALQVPDTSELEAAIVRLLAHADQRQRLGEAARQLVREQQGATERTIQLIEQLLPSQAAHVQAA